MSASEFRSIGLLRSCSRCGTDFRWNGRARLCASCKTPKPTLKPLNSDLSFRERQVVNLVARGKLNKEIAYELHLAEGTIKEYLNRIFRKIGTTNRTELAVWALTHKVIHIDERLAHAAARS